LRIVAAIHADTSEATEQAINTTILEWALMLKERARAELTLLQAWTVFGGSVLRSRLPHDEFAEYVEVARRGAEEGMAVLTEPFQNRLVGVTVESRQGEAEELITQFVKSQGIDVVVMGTVARTGIAGLLMGNTAERILQRFHGSVCAVNARLRIAGHGDGSRRCAEGTKVTW
jgi:universal stress protein E